MLCYFKICFLLSSKIHRRPALLPPTHSKWPRPLPIFWQPLLQELIILQWVLKNGCAKTWYLTHPALLHWPEKESSYLSPNYSSQAAWAGQSATGWSKQLGKKNWGWDTCSSSLFLVNALLPTVLLAEPAQILYYNLAIKRTPHYGVQSTRPRGVNIGGVRIPHPHYHTHIKKCSSRYTLFSTF